MKANWDGVEGEGKSNGTGNGRAVDISWLPPFAEWDFRGINERESRLACCWEYARSVPAISNDPTGWAVAQGAVTTLGKFILEEGLRFPEPWLLASDAVRSAGERVKGEAAPGTAVPLVIQEAITARHVLLLDYRDRHNVMTSREVEPVAFAGTRAHWYLVAWCRLRGGARAFRMDRIHAAVDTGEPAPHRSYGDLDVDIPDALVRRLDFAG